MGQQRLTLSAGLVTVTFLLSACTTSTAGNSQQSLNGSYNIMPNNTQTGWSKTPLPIAVFTRENCNNSAHDAIFGPKAVPTGNESFTGILASAGASLIVDGVSAILKSAGEARTDLSPVETSFTLSIDEGPRCFEIQKLKKESSGFAIELGLQQGGTSGDDDKYFRLIPTRLRYKGPDNGLFQLLDGKKRALALNAEISQLDGTSKVTFTINLGEWKSMTEDIYLNGEALKGSTIDTSKLEVAGPWFILAGSAESERPYNVKFTLIETKSENALAKMLAAEVETRKADIKEQLTTSFTPAPKPTQAELQKNSDNAFALITAFCSRHRPPLEKAAKGLAMSDAQIMQYNLDLNLLTDGLAGTSYATATQSVAPLSLGAEGEIAEINSNKGAWAKAYIQSDFNKLCGAGS